VLSIITNILALFPRDPEVHKNLNERFLSSEILERVSGRAHVFSRVGCLQLMRDLMLYGNEQVQDSESSVQVIGELALLTNEFLEPEPQLPSQLSDLDVVLLFVPRWDVDNPDDLAYAVTRMFTILTELLPGQDPNVKRLSSTIGLNSKTLAVDGLPLGDFLAIAFGLFAFSRKVSEKRERAVFNFDNLLAKSSLSQSIVDRFREDRGLTLAEFRERLGGTEGVTLESFVSEIRGRSFLSKSLNVFRTYPLLKFEKARCLVLDLQFLSELLSNGVYWRIFDPLPTEALKKSFRELWGYLFELYATRLLREFYPPASQMLQTDVRYGRGQIDALIDSGADVFVFEMKGSLLTEAAKRFGNRAKFEADVRKKFVMDGKKSPKAAVQLARSCQALAGGKITTAIVPKRIYPILVSPEPAVTCLCFNSYLDGIFAVEVGSSRSIRPLTVMSVNEFEEMLAYVSAGVFGWRDLLEERFQNGFMFSVHQAIYDWRQRKGLEPLRNQSMFRDFERVYKLIADTYGFQSAP
jgi:hypothetical protein